MAIGNYGIVKGKAIAGRPGSRPGDHYLVHVVAERMSFRFSINVKSRQRPHELLYLLSDDYRHPILAELAALSPGFHRLRGRRHPLALDYVRGELFDRRQMKTIPYALPGANNDLNERLQLLIARAIAEPGAVIYGYGDRWGPETDPDDAFGFAPGNGVHDIHMNQGSNDYQIGERSFKPENGVWQDGALFIHFHQEQRWTALFLAFQSQSWQTDNRTGEPQIEVASSKWQAASRE